MARRKPRGQRPFRPEALGEYAKPLLRPRIGSGATLYRFTIVVPLEEVSPEKRQKATNADLYEMQEAFSRDFGGCTRLPDSPGYGLRDPDNPGALPEMNYNAYFVVLTSPVPETDDYFRALRKELEEALAEGVILIERQVVYLV